MSRLTTLPGNHLWSEARQAACPVRRRSWTAGWIAMVGGGRWVRLADIANSSPAPASITAIVDSGMLRVSGNTPGVTSATVTVNGSTHAVTATGGVWLYTETATPSTTYAVTATDSFGETLSTSLSTPPAPTVSATVSKGNLVVTGTSVPASSVRIAYNASTYLTNADSTGHYQATLPATPSTGYTIVVTNSSGFSATTFITTPAALPSSSWWVSGAYGAGKYVIIAAEGGSGPSPTAWSTDGVHWTQAALPFLSGGYSWTKICFGSDKFVAVGQDSRAAWSSDGITWTPMTLPTSAAWFSLVYGNGKFLVISEGVGVISSNGTAWTRVSLPYLSYGQSWTAAACGGGKFVVIASSTGAGNQNSVAACSDDGVTWATTALPAAKYWVGCAYGNGTFVAIATQSNAVAYSADGITWSAASLPVSTFWQTVIFANGKFVALAYGTSVAAYSTDGITWTQTALPFSGSWQFAVYGSGTFVAAAFETSQYAVSADGITWSLP